VWINDAQVAFWPEKNLSPAQTYQLHLKAGAAGVQGPSLQQELVWQVAVRPSRVLYLSPSGAPELWQVSDTGEASRRLTDTGGAVYDYGVSRDGSRIAYSAANEQKGKDLWEIRLPEGRAALLLSCGPDWCTSPAYSPGNDRIAYSRRKFSGAPGSAPAAPLLWMLRTETGETDALFIDPNFGGQAAGWSPDGRFLASVDEINQGVRVVDFQQDVDIFLPSGSGAAFSWSPDSSAVFMTRAEATSAFPYVLVYQVEISTRVSSLWTVDDTADFSVPTWTPDGEWAAVARRAIDGVPGKQLWLASKDGFLEKAITDDPLANYASYHWDASGSMLVFQRLEIGGSASHPDVMIWDRLKVQFRTLAQDAFLPQWIP
jgi:Tol biopolymer transport system component